MKKQRTKNSLLEIPGVGPSITYDFNKIGIKKISDLKGKNPEELYLKICANQGGQVDRCILYVCRSSVYFAENKTADPEKLKWWNWKNSKNNKIEENNR